MWIQYVLPYIPSHLGTASAYESVGVDQYKPLAVASGSVKLVPRDPDPL